MKHQRKALRVILTAALCACAAFVASPSVVAANTTGQWVAGDFHTHTALSDGVYTAEEVAAKAKYFGLDWYSATDHGGLYYLDDTFVAGRKANTSRALTILGIGTQKVTANRNTIMQFNGFEWNVPTHEHASVGIIGNDDAAVAKALSDFEYQYDAKDTDTSITTLSKLNSKADQAIFAAAYLQSFYAKTSYMLPNHPSRQLLWTAADFRDMNDAAPDVAFGAELLPGHQASAFRGGLGYFTYYDTKAKKFINLSATDATTLEHMVINYVTIPANDLAIAQGKLDNKATILASLKVSIEKQRTYGGADYMLAKVGGVWDSLLGEGRNFWVFGNSDFHINQTKATVLGGEPDFWPGEYTKNYTYTSSKTYQSILDGMRSGNSFTVLGDLINALDFTVANNGKTATMGERLNATTGKTTTMTIRFKSPAHNSANQDGRTGLNDVPVVDHIDLIAGEYGEKAEKYDANYTGEVASEAISAAYKKDTNETTKVIKTFSKSDFKTDAEGYTTVTFTVPATDKNTYYRLRGTNLAPNTPNQTDANGNPLVDTALTSVKGTNTAAEAFSDLWFYSNPIFVNAGTAIQTGTQTDTETDVTDGTNVINPHTGSDSDSAELGFMITLIAFGAVIIFARGMIRSK